MTSSDERSSATACRGRPCRCRSAPSLPPRRKTGRRIIARCFWAVLSNDGERRIVGELGASYDRRVPERYPGYPEIYLMDGTTIRRRPQQPGQLYPDARAFYAAYDWTVVSERVNQGEPFRAWREHLSAMVDEFLSYHGFEDGTLTDIATRGWFNHQIAEGDAARRNKVISHWFPEYLGMVWRLLHKWGAIDATVTDDWKAAEAPLRAIVEPFCENCEGVSRIRHIRRHLDLDAWETKLAEGHRVLPDFPAGKPWAPALTDTDHGVNSYYSRIDRQNFVFAADWHGDAGLVKDAHPDYLSQSVQLPDLGAYTLLPGTNLGNRTSAVNEVRELYVGVRDHRLTTPELLRATRKFAEMWLLAIPRLENWPPTRGSFVTEVLKMILMTVDTVLDPTHGHHQALIQRWGDASAHVDEDAWRHGFLIFNADRDMLVTDYLITDVAAEPWTITESAAPARGDFRRASRFVVVGGTEVDDTMGTVAAERPWLEQAERLAWVDTVIGPDPGTVV